MNTAYLLTGGNVGNRQQYLNNSAGLIELRCGSIVKKSSLYQTAPWGNTNQAAFLNQAIQLVTKLAAPELMHELLAIETEAGRVRNEKFGPRTIDIDMLFYNDSIINTNLLQLPHPFIASRRFVLEPLNEIAPYLVHPVLQKDISTLLRECTDQLAVKKFSPA